VVELKKVPKKELKLAVFTFQLNDPPCPAADHDPLYVPAEKGTPGLLVPGVKVTPERKPCVPLLNENVPLPLPDKATCPGVGVFCVMNVVSHCKERAC
jgi:hypothetical protein